MFEKVSLMVNANFRTAYYTLATDEKYPVLNRENLTIPIQMQLSPKKKTSSQFFAAFLKSRLNFECFQKKKNDPHSFCISKTTDSEHVVR